MENWATKEGKIRFCLFKTGEMTADGANPEEGEIDEGMSLGHK